MADPRIKVFKDVSEIIGAVIDMDNLLDAIILTATRLMNAKASSLLLRDEQTGKLFFHIVTGEKKEEVKRFELEKGEGIAGWVVEHGQPLLVANVKEDPRWSDKVAAATNFETNSIACAPLKVGDKILGVLEIIDHIDGQNLEQEDLDILVSFSDLAALLILKSQIYTSMNKQNKQLREELSEKYDIIGNSPEIQKVISDCSRVAHSAATVLIVGESGTGKELIARYIHSASPRKDFPFVVVNCGALTETLLESELFGHEKGAFTGADSRKQGLFEAASKGTIFLDEIGETSPNMQVKLLRVLQEGTLNRVGSTHPINVDVRVLAATNKNIIKLVEDKEFREDLYYRLNVVCIKVPPLRQRKGEVILLAEHFLNKFKKESNSEVEDISEDAKEVLARYSWPGNIRQLENTIERAVIMGRGKLIEPADLPYEMMESKRAKPEVGMTLKEAQENFKRDFIKRTLTSVGGSKTKAAGVLDIQRTYLSRVIKDLNIQ